MLSTRSGREIPNAQDPDLAPAAAAHATELFRRKYPLARLRRGSSGQYNCHGLTFANRRTGIYDIQALESVLDDDGYRRIPRKDVEPGDILVCYDQGEISHTGVVLEVTPAEGIPGLVGIRVVSKWGGAAEYVHMDQDGPYNDHQISYWTDRHDRR